MEGLYNDLGQPIDDVEEEVFLVFSQTIPSRGLGFVDSKASTLNITIGDVDLEIHQSPTLLSSNRKEGTTGAVVWEVTPLFATWLISANNLLFTHGFLTSGSIVLELGCGVSGIIPLTLSTKVAKYIATDQDYVLKMLKQNLEQNGSKRRDDKGRNRTKSSQAPRSNLQVMTLDWETDSVSGLPSALGQSAKDNTGVDLVIACDCIYNDALIEPFVTTCVDICRLRVQADLSKPTLCVVAQQLRSADVFESWLKASSRMFRVWRVPDEHLSKELGEDSGFVVHVGILK